MVGIERNKDPDLTPKERNTSYFVILDDRKHGRSGKFPVFYDIDTGDYLEPPEGFLESECQTLKEWFNIHGDTSDVSKQGRFEPLSKGNVEEPEPEPTVEGETASQSVTDDTQIEVYTGMDDDEEDAPF